VGKPNSVIVSRDNQYCLEQSSRLVVHYRRHLRTKGKERKRIYIAPFVYYVYL